MKLTKEECEQALDHFEECYWYQDNSYSAMNGVRKDLEILNKLINEHFDNPKKIDWLKNAIGEYVFNLIFSSEEEVKKWVERNRWHVIKCDELALEIKRLKSNPPLEFEELKEGMWVWDNKYKYYGQIYETKKLSNGTFRIICYRDMSNFDFVFEENRFFRKQVEE